MRSLWQNNIDFYRDFPTLEGDINTDVLVIGGGIAGILTAYFLRNNGISCILAEKDKIGSGTTGYTTAKITIQHGLIYNKLLRKEGFEKSKAYLQANQAAFDKYTEMCRNIDCDFEYKDNYVYSVNDRKKLEDETDALGKIGYKADFCEKIPLPLENVGAVCFKNQAQFHPLKFLYSIAKDINIYEHTFIREMIGTTAVTDHGKIHADTVVIASHFPFINKHGSYFLKLYQHRSYVIALENAQDVKGMYVDCCNTGYSFRNYKNLLLLGGGAHRTGKQGGGRRELQRFAAENYPDSKEIYHWAAQDCMSIDDMPYIGQYSKNTPNMYVACGFNKWGITGSMLSAMLLSDIISGRSNEYAEVFSPSRNFIKPQLFINGFEAAKNLLTFSQKRCPHMGCALKWNSAEHSWDCPCHGSRFSSDGEVLDNPANGNLRSR